jgi:hypothetical protein
LIHERRLSATLLCCEPFQHCHPNGSSLALSIMWQQDSLKSSYRHRRFDRPDSFSGAQFQAALAALLSQCLPRVDSHSPSNDGDGRKVTHLDSRLELISAGSF